MWWDEASKKTYTPPVKEEDKTKTSSTKRPSMLPEGTVVEEIPQKDVVPLDNKTTAVKPDAKPTEDSIPTTSTTAAPTPETKVEEKEVPPKRMFPKSNIVHHFHPIAWVEQMKLVFGSSGVIRKGDKGEIVRELNIRLAGFGGNIPTDVFTSQTENIVSQFQKDYMGITPTGEVTNEELKAIDEFSKKFDISDEFWKKIKCRCSTKGSIVTSVLRGKSESNKCEGFGDHTGKSTYRPDKSKSEPYHMYEYPGMHRSLLFGIKALQFYLSKQTTFKIDHVSSGYRCRFKNYKSTNHMGKAIDIQFSKGSWEIRSQFKKNVEPLREIRDDFYIKYLGAQKKWKNPNMFSIEPIDLKYKKNGKVRFDHTYSWIHIDVRNFESKYLEDYLFCKDRSTLNGENISSMSNDTSEKEQLDYKWSQSAFANIISNKESNNNYNICNKTKGGLKVVRNITVVETTIKDILAKQKSRDIFAVGRFQLIPNTLTAAINSLNLDVNNNLDEETQDKIFQEYLITIKRPQIMKFLEESGSVEDAMYSAAKEWASIGVEIGKKISKNRISKGGESYYAGDGLNKAHITPDEFKNSLIKSKNEN